MKNIKKYTCSVNLEYTVELDEKFWNEERIREYSELYEDGYIENVEDFINHVCLNEAQGITEFQPDDEETCYIYLNDTYCDTKESE